MSRCIGIKAGGGRLKENYSPDLQRLSSDAGRLVTRAPLGRCQGELLELAIAHELSRVGRRLIGDECERLGAARSRIVPVDAANNAVVAAGDENRALASCSRLTIHTYR